MPTDCDFNQKSEPIWVLLIQSAQARNYTSIFIFQIFSCKFLRKESNVLDHFCREKCLGLHSLFLQFSFLFLSCITEITVPNFSMHQVFVSWVSYKSFMEVLKCGSFKIFCHTQWSNVSHLVSCMKHKNAQCNAPF